MIVPKKESCFYKTFTFVSSTISRTQFISYYILCDAVLQMFYI